MAFAPGFEIAPTKNPIGFVYGEDVFGPEVEIRRLDDIRESLSDPNAQGPDELYAIAMDVGDKADREEIAKRNLLFGVVTYAAGMIGREPVRSQGHKHAISASCGASTPEVYEIWDGEAVIYMQESGSDNPGKCYAIYARPKRNLTFGAWCVRDYGFDYETVRNHGGIAYYPFVENGSLKWSPNPAYSGGELIIKNARTWEDFSLEAGVPVYTQFQKDKERFMFVADPARCPELWKNFEP